MSVDALIQFFGSNIPVSTVFVISLISLIFSSYRFAKLSDKGLNQLTVVYLSLLILSFVGIINTYKAYEIFYVFSYSPTIVK